MNFHHDELALAAAYERGAGFEALTDEQTHAIMNRGRALFHWFKSHLALHYAISIAVFVLLFAADWWVQVRLPAWLVLGLWFVLQWVYSAGYAVSEAGSVAYLAHAIGFALGVLIAIPVRLMTRPPPPTYGPYWPPPPRTWRRLA